MRSMPTMLHPATEATRSLATLMANYPCYAYIGNVDHTGARALFRGRWDWDVVRQHLFGEPTAVIIDDERASGYMRFRLYQTGEGGPVCLAEIEVYFSRGSARKSFWCEAGDAEGRLALAA
ncbi:MAG: hypothetical protein VKN33_10905 [Candidatus Sericytochromatia bacterium]|nr:hypothetical protein [Candidatus Sericytochromatia bacterium]